MNDNPCVIFSRSRAHAEHSTVAAVQATCCVRVTGDVRGEPLTHRHTIVPIAVNLDLMLVKRKMSLTKLSHLTGLTLANLSILKTNKSRAVRFTTLAALCRALDCQPADLLEYRPERFKDSPRHQ